ncbi:hypothetical protein B0J18DRAFT_24763 [Chaetomium sp. MPI-SDFR-AT-0129]|nr:hypothetical protein B0J18DRAFT_24763 [Chaetomium sp. MPI-SDFR-AT-0129]
MLTLSYTILSSMFFSSGRLVSFPSRPPSPVRRFGPLLQAHAPCHHTPPPPSQSSYPTPTPPSGTRCSSHSLCGWASRLHSGPPSARISFQRFCGVAVNAIPVHPLMLMLVTNTNLSVEGSSLRSVRLPFPNPGSGKHTTELGYRCLSPPHHHRKLYLAAPRPYSPRLSLPNTTSLQPTARTRSKPAVFICSNPGS